MITVTAGETFACSAEEVLDFVMDIERYQQVDDKIRPVLWTRRTGNRVEFACRPKLGGIRVPGPAVVQWIQLSPGRRVDIGLVPSRWTRVVDFEASFACTPTRDGTRVDRRLTFRFAPVLRWLFEPLLARRLPAEVRGELRAARDYLESAPAA